MNKIIEDGVIRINEQSFLEFTRAFHGYYIIDRKTGYVVAKFMLFWKGLTFEQVKKHYNLQLR